MARIPQRPIDNPSIPVGIGGQISPQFAASSVFQANRTLAALANQFGDIAERAQQAEENRVYHQTVTDLDRSWTEKWLKAQEKAPERPIGLASALRDEYDSDVEAAVQAAPSRIQDQLRARLSTKVNEYYSRAAAFEHTALIASDKRAVAEVGDTAAETVLRDPGQFDTQLTQFDAAVADAETVLPPAELVKVREAGHEKLAIAAIQGMASESAAEALGAVKAGAFDDYLEADQIGKLTGQLEAQVEREKSQSEAEGRARQADYRAQVRFDMAMEKERLHQARQETANGFLARLNDPTNEDGALTRQEVIASDLPAFGVGSKATFLDMLDQDPAATQKTDPAVYNDLFLRIQDGQITDEAELLPFVGQGLKPSDVRLLGQDIAAMNKPAETAEEEYQKATDDLLGDFLKAAKSQLDLTTLFGKDPKGSELFYRFNFIAKRRYDAAVKAGEDPLTLLDPTSKDYLGKLLSAPPFKRTPRDIMNSQLEALRGLSGTPDENARQPGESIDDFLERTGK